MKHVIYALFVIHHLLNKQICIRTSKLSNQKEGITNIINEKNTTDKKEIDPEYIKSFLHKLKEAKPKDEDIWDDGEVEWEL